MNLQHALRHVAVTKLVRHPELYSAFFELADALDAQEDLEEKQHEDAFNDAMSHKTYGSGE